MEYMMYMERGIYWNYKFIESLYLFCCIYEEIKGKLFRIYALPLSWSTNKEIYNFTKLGIDAMPIYGLRSPNLCSLCSPR